MNAVRKMIRKGATAAAKRNVPLRKFMRFGMNACRKTKYAIHTMGAKADEKTVMFNAFNGKSYSCTPKAVYEYMLSSEEYKEYKFIWVARDPELFGWLADNPRTSIVKDKSKEYIKALASAKYWIFNYRIYDYIYPKKDQVYVQCWHGTPLKRLGYDIEHSNNAMNSSEEIRYKYRTDAEKFKYILSPSAFASDKFASAWNLNETGQRDKVIEVGYPRNDFLQNYDEKCISRIKEELKIPKDKKVLLYAPTWRDNQHMAGVGYVYSNPVDFSKWREKLGEDWVILFRAHYLVAGAFDFNEYEGFVYNVSQYSDINELYIISDMLITDYSSVFFDYANLKRPILFYMYDLDAYKNELRGFYIDLEELPGPVEETEDVLIEKIKNFESWFVYDEHYRKFNDKYNYLNDGKASKRFVERVIDGAVEE